MPSIATSTLILGLPPLLLWAAHAKSLPLSYTLRSWLLLRSLIKRAQQNKFQPDPLFSILSQDHRCLFDDMDYNQHMNNSSYNKMLDFSRIQVLYTIFSRVMMEPNHGVYAHNAGVVTLFKKEIPPFQKYKMQSRVFTWSEKWLFLEHRFVFTQADNTLVVASAALSKIVFKRASGKTVTPAHVLTLCLHDLNDPLVEERRARNWKIAQNLLSLDTIFSDNHDAWDITSKL
ncbi:uncharacterized protein BX664DRAFT_327916 [Halteromyces radiatus]|uniref:uncharacterized protein n=1 Tax=Halteromyces radiatus TaxID=101107 RepID=UPI00221F15D5|nr:uncharacterized protein BX664DRAFT_327916 [Halteromyces radiatus]KAI8092694.1 hypothetical protein BX664DRAFT_327916 [Halteromyces radiatus]